MTKMKRWKFDPDIEPLVQEMIKSQINLEDFSCSCGSYTMYAARIGNEIDIKCYECGESFAELEIESE